MKTPLPPVLRAALYRRAVACAWLTVCERQHRYPVSRNTALVFRYRGSGRTATTGEVFLV